LNEYVRFLLLLHLSITMRYFTTFCLFVLLFSSCKTAFVRTVVYNDPGINDLHILPTREIKASSQPFEIPYATSVNTKLLPDSLVDALTTTKTVAFLVMKHDSIVYEWYAKGYSDSSHTNPFSATKAIVGVLTGIALKEGKIKSLDEPVGNYLPSFSQDERNKITFRHLLTMSSGVDYYDQYINPFGKLSKLYYGNDMQKLDQYYTCRKGTGHGVAIQKL
jgi:CubicO group peptidase (beta-lactamase class C family)